MKNPCEEIADEMARTCPARMTTAELLLLLAEVFGDKRSGITDATGMSESQLALVGLAIKFSRRTDLILPAIIESWDRSRITREMF